MLSYAIRRLLLVVPTLAGMSAVIFLMVRLIPGNAADTIANGGDVLASPASRKALEHELGLDQPWPVQYGKWIGGLFDGNLGHSLITGRAVSTILGGALPITVELTIFAALVATIFAIPLGVLSATRANSGTDFGIRSITLFGLSIPDFWLATLILLFTSVEFNWTPPNIWTPITHNLLRNLSEVAIPGSILAVFVLAATTRMTRTTMLDVLAQDYIRTARAKGLTTRRVVYRHALRNALVPVLSLSGVQIASLISGATILETVFGLPGVGYTLTQSIYSRDYPVIESAALMLALIVVVLNVAIDLLYGLVDPRINQR
jgi:peptide/nickel transport system permease protein